VSNGLDGPTLRRAMTLFAEALEVHRDELDSLNVFPVPDGDTGTNLLLTQRAVAAALPPSGSLEDVAAALAETALGSARGNSGVILSQVYEGFARGVAGASWAGSESLAAALREGSRSADRTMSDPKEGTILTVLRAAADEAEVHADDADPANAVRAALAAARRTLEDTRDVLPDLRRAGVVDAGGKGIVLLLDALRAALTDGSLSEPVGPPGPVARGSSEVPAGPGPGSAERFELQLRIAAPEVGPLRDALAAVGDSVAVGGGPGRWLVHVHTHDPVAAAAGAADLGPTEVLSVTSLQAVRERAGSTRMVALVEAEGLSPVLRSLGAVVVPYRHGRPPPAAQMAAAIGVSRAELVVVATRGAPPMPRDLPRPSANGPGGATRLETLTVGGPIALLAAAAAFDPSADVAVNLARMRAAAAAVLEVEVSGPEGLPERAAELALGVAEPELITVLVGASASSGDRRRVEAVLRERYPDAEVKVLDGGQPSAAFLIGME
jgi:dihydroxyacetone kinase-like predicted kinase